ncbi:MAG: hypothetical protein ACHQ5A_02400 [Opitutales bacterium]
MSPKFIDLVAILAAGEAAHAGWNVYASNPLDPLNRPHVYGPWWLVTGSVGLVRADAWWLGLVLVGLFLAVAIVVLAPRNARAALGAVLLLVSTPTLLAMERGNNDLVVFLFLVAAVWFATRTNRFAVAVSGGLMVVASALKLYPFAALPALAVRPGSRRMVLWTLFSFSALLGLFVLPSLDVYWRVITIAPSPQTVFAHGAKLAYYILQQLPQQRVWVLTGGLSVVIAGFGFGWRWRRVFWSMLPVTGFTSGCYVAGALAWGFCYVTTTSFPYRMILLLLPARFWLQGRPGEETPWARRWQCGLTVLICWAPALKSFFLDRNPGGKFYITSPKTWMAIGAEQGLVLVVASSLAVVVVGWAWRRLSKATDEC